jgi:hypothetical protein
VKGFHFVEAVQAVPERTSRDLVIRTVTLCTCLMHLLCSTYRQVFHLPPAHPPLHFLAKAWKPIAHTNVQAGTMPTTFTAYKQCQGVYLDILEALIQKVYAVVDEHVGKAQVRPTPTLPSCVRLPHLPANKSNTPHVKRSPACKITVLASDCATK